MYRQNQDQNVHVTNDTALILTRMTRTAAADTKWMSNRTGDERMTAVHDTGDMSADTTGVTLDR